MDEETLKKFQYEKTIKMIDWQFILMLRIVENFPGGEKASYLKGVVKGYAHCANSLDVISLQECLNLHECVNCVDEIMQVLKIHEVIHRKFNVFK